MLTAEPPRRKVPRSLIGLELAPIHSVTAPLREILFLNYSLGHGNPPAGAKTQRSVKVIDQDFPCGPWRPCLRLTHFFLAVIIIQGRPLYLIPYTSPTLTAYPAPQTWNNYF